MSLPSPDLTIDARGHHCPVPTLKLRKAFKDLPGGAVVVLRVDDPMAKVDVPHFAAEAGHEVLAIDPDGAGLAFTVRKRA